MIDALGSSKDFDGPRPTCGTGPVTRRVLALGLAGAIGTALSAQQPPTFRAQVEAIQVDAGS